MQCSVCRHDNAPEAKFCASCGTALAAEDTVNCPNCGQANPSDGRYCNNCGTGLATGCPNCSRRDSRSGVFCQWCDQMLVGPAGSRQLVSDGGSVRTYWTLFFSS